MSLPEDEVASLLDEVSAEFSQRHPGIRGNFLERSKQVRELQLAAAEISQQRGMLIGSCFLAEYSLESAALFNPSIVPHPDQTGQSARDRGGTHLLDHVPYGCPAS
jgi:hypothetical protein